MKRCLFAILLLPIFAFGQTAHTAIAKVLSTKDNVTIQKYLGNIGNNEIKNISFRQDVITRDIVQGFTEQMYYIREWVEQTEDTLGKYVYDFTIVLIATDKDIVECIFTLERNKLVNGEWEPYQDSLLTYKNDSLFSILNKQFTNDFAAPLNYASLYDQKTTYGSSCGYSGNKPALRRQLDTLVNNNERAAILKLLQSGNTETQIYGVQGFKELKEKGIEPTKTELQIIKNVLNKKGIIRTCSGCIYLTMYKQDLNDTFKF